MEEKTNVPAQQDKGAVTYQVAGQEVKLSFATVRKYLVRGNAAVTDAELVLFISICKFNQLNPFLNEAYLIKFEGKNPTAQMVVSKEALMKRAENCPEYEGFKAGVIVMRGNETVNLEGCFTLPDDKLTGGWAEVYRKDRKYPFVSRVAISEYDKGPSVPLWAGKKATMIRKTAIVQAMREAFPTQLGAMYTAEEQDIQDIPYEDVTVKVEREKSANANQGDPVGFPEEAESVDPETGEIKEPTQKAESSNAGSQTNKRLF
jgi:phage recombination protein Bet